MADWSEETVVRTRRRWRISTPTVMSTLGVVERKAAAAWWDARVPGTRQPVDPNNPMVGLPDDALTYEGNEDEIVIWFETEQAVKK